MTFDEDFMPIDTALAWASGRPDTLDAGYMGAQAMRSLAAEVIRLRAAMADSLILAAEIRALPVDGSEA